MYYRPQASQKKPAQRRSDLKKFPAPTGGWISNRNLSSPMIGEGTQGQGAAVLDNFFPTSTTAILRRGKELYATLGDGLSEVKSLFTYVNGLNRKMFSSTDTTIYDVTSVTTPYNWRLVTQDGDYIVTDEGDFFGRESTQDLEAFEGALGGEWIVTQMATSGGVFLVGVNGASDGFIYDGNAFYPYIEGGAWSVTYDNVVSEFTVGEIVTGSASGASGTVYRVLPNGVLEINKITTTPETYTLAYNEADGIFSIGGTIAGDVSRAFGTVNEITAIAEYDLPYYRVSTAIPNGATITGSLSGAEAVVVNNTPGPSQWRLPFDHGTSLFKVDEKLTGQTSNATGTVIRLEDYQVEYDLEYDGGTAAFAAGTIITGANSNARAEIVSVDGTTSSGTLILKDLYGSFRDNEPITGDAGGAALANGTNVGGYSSGAAILEGVTGTFSNNEIIKGASQGSASVNGTATGPFASGVLRVKDLEGNFVYNDVLTGTPTGSAIAVSAQGTAIYNGVITLRNVSGSFSGGEEISQGGVVTGNATSDSVYVGGGYFRDNETLTGDLGGQALAASNAINIVPGVAFPDGITSANMSYVWVYKNRIWFAQKDTLDIWYMDAPDSVGGSPAIYPMGGILTKGGTVLWGEAWAIGTGAAGGLSDQMVVTSTEGEVAVFQGSYPEATGDWMSVGVYQIGRPLGKKAQFRGGGDIAVATSVGLIPLSKAISLDVTALSPAAVSYNIQDAWQQAVDGRGMTDWNCMLWPEKKMAIISPPVTIGTYDPILLISNSETGAWCRYTNWDARCMCVFQGEMYFGGPNGEIFKANVTGNDNGNTYTGVYIPLFDDLGSPANLKIPKMGRGVTRAKASLQYGLRFKSDFDIDPGSAPTASSSDGTNAWGEGVWGQAVWGGTNPNVFNAQWKSLGGTGYYMSACYQVTSGSTVPLDVEIVHIELSYTMAEIVT